MLSAERIVIMNDCTRQPTIKPWGNYIVLADQPNHKVKRITVSPGERLSLQEHKRRSEYWIVVSGEGIVTCGDHKQRVTAGDVSFIPLSTPHRVEATGSKPLIFVEVQLGTYFGEDDIIRLEDDYGRTDLV
jgi:mannose-6-phosphate isomerase-like protein (cupin superfamily)